MRTLTYNVLACTGWPPRRARRKWPGDEGGGDVSAEMACALAKLQLDVITLSEAPDVDVIQGMAAELGMEVAYFPSGKRWPGAVMTNLPIKEMANCPVPRGERPLSLFTRHFGRVLLESRWGDLVVYSAHLHPRSARIRAREISLVLEAVGADLESGHQILLQGDLNHPPTGPEYPRWTAAGLVDAFASAGTGPGATMEADAPQARIDYIWADASMGKRLQKAQTVYTPPFGPGIDAQGSSPFLSDHLPVMAWFA